MGSSAYGHDAGRCLSCPERERERETHGYCHQWRVSMAPVSALSCCCMCLHATRRRPIRRPQRQHARRRLLARISDELPSAGQQGKRRAAPSDRRTELTSQTKGDQRQERAPPSEPKRPDHWRPAPASQLVRWCTSSGGRTTARTGRAISGAPRRGRRRAANAHGDGDAGADADGRQGGETSKWLATGTCCRVRRLRNALRRQACATGRPPPDLPG